MPKDLISAAWPINYVRQKPYSNCFLKEML